MTRGRPLHAVPRTFFGMHNNKVNYTPDPTPNHDLGFGSVRTHDAFVFWKQIETAKGVYDWSRLDTLVAAHAGRTLLYTMGQTPNWANGQSTTFYQFGPVPPTNPQDYVDFTTALAIRNRDVYNGAITAWEVWNEPDNVKLWTGTAQQLIDLSAPAVAAIRAVDPNAIIVSPGGLASGWAWFHDYARRGGLSYCDKVGYHAYASPSQPERVEVYIRRIKASLNALGIDKPIWNTEFGYLGYTYGGVTYDNLTANPLVTMPGPLAASYVVRAYLSAINSGVERAYWYAMDAPVMIIQLADRADETQLLPAAYAYKRLADLLSGGGLGDIVVSGDLHSATLLAGDGRMGKVLWCGDSRTATVNLSGYATGMDALGVSITPTGAYAVTDLPIYVFQ